MNQSDKNSPYWKLYKQARECVWTTEEIDFSGDMCDWKNKLNDDEREFISKILKFFAGADNIVIENIFNEIVDKFQHDKSIISFFCEQLSIETVHADTYTLMLDTFVKNNDINEYYIKEKFNFMQEIGDLVSLPQKIFFMVCVEGIFFSSSFCAIYWLKKRGLCPGITFSNELISRDEGMHVNFTIALLNNQCIITRNDRKRFREIMKRFVAQEIYYIENICPEKLIGINISEMSKYVKHVSNVLMKLMKLPPLYDGINNPFPWMDMISLEGKTNFFEKRVGEYSKSTSKKEFSMDENF